MLSPDFRSPSHRGKGLPRSHQQTQAGSRRWWLSSDLSPHIAAPKWLRGTSGPSVASFGSLTRVGSIGASRQGPLGVTHTCGPIRQGLETGGALPVGQRPLRLSSPYNPSAQHGFLAACLAPHHAFQRHAATRAEVLSRFASTVHGRPNRAQGDIDSHSIDAPRGAQLNQST